MGKINFCFFHVSGSCLCQSPYICAHVTPMNIPWDVDNSCALVRHSLLQAAPHPHTTAWHAITARPVWRASTVWSARPHRAYTPCQGSGQVAGSSRRQNLYRYFHCFSESWLFSPCFSVSCTLLILFLLFCFI